MKYFLGVFFGKDIYTDDEDIKKLIEHLNSEIKTLRERAT